MIKRFSDNVETKSIKTAYIVRTVEDYNSLVENYPVIQWDYGIVPSTSIHSKLGVPIMPQITVLVLGSVPENRVERDQLEDALVNAVAYNLRIIAPPGRYPSYLLALFNYD
jgi:hypothetical protein